MCGQNAVLGQSASGCRHPRNSISFAEKTERLTRVAKCHASPSVPTWTRGMEAQFPPESSLWTRHTHCRASGSLPAGRDAPFAIRASRACRVDLAVPLRPWQLASRPEPWNGEARHGGQANAPPMPRVKRPRRRMWPGPKSQRLNNNVANLRRLHHSFMKPRARGDLLGVKKGERFDAPSPASVGGAADGAGQGRLNCRPEVLWWRARRAARFADILLPPSAA
jgi:hypothetical protein